MASKAKVTSGFSKFMTKNASAVEEARKAENTMQTCKMPLGWSGFAICVDAVADQGKDRKDDKGETQEGNPYVRLEFQVVNDEEYAGQKFSNAWSFYDSEKATAMDRFEWCMNALENMGLPEELRRGDADMAEILNFFIDNDTVYAAEVVKNAYRRGDQKEVRITTTEAVDDTDSVVPNDTQVEVGGEVKFMGKPWEVMDIDEDDVKIKSKSTGREKTVKLTDLE